MCVCVCVCVIQQSHSLQLHYHSLLTNSTFPCLDEWAVPVCEMFGRHSVGSYGGGAFNTSQRRSLRLQDGLA